MTVNTREEATRLAALVPELARHDIDYVIARVGAGADVSGRVFDDAGLPTETGMDSAERDSSTERFAGALVAAERLLSETRPSVAVLASVRDGALAVGLTASRLGIPVAMIGAGRRAGDLTGRADVNRVLCDRLADLIFVDNPETSDALAWEGVARNQVFCVGDPAVDLARAHAPRALLRPAPRPGGLPTGGYVLVDLECDGASDRQQASIVSALADLGKRIPLVMVVNSGLRARLESAGDLGHLAASGAHVLAPQGYLDALGLLAGTAAVLTDSPVAEAEAHELGITCYLFTRTAPSVDTLEERGTVLLGDDPAEIAAVAPGRRRLAAPGDSAPEAAQRIVSVLMSRLQLGADRTSPVMLSVHAG